MNVQEIINTYGPAVWAAAQRQVQVDAQLDTFWLAVFGGLAIGLLILAVVGAVMGHGKYLSDWNFTAMLAVGGAVIALLAMAFIGSDLYSIQQNPTGRAIAHVHDYVSPGK